MDKIITNRSIVVWILLILLTLFAFLLGWLNLVNLLLVSILLLTTFIKGQLVIDHFMALRHVQLKWRIIPSAWLFIVMLFIALAYYLPVNN